MGVVYRARDTRLKREVALKLIRSDHAGDSSYLRRFEREAQSLAAVNHPGIGTIHGIEEHDGAVFLVLEMVSGRTLGERLRESPLPWREAVDVASQIADALDAAHEKGIIHRDLKPSNVMITPEGRVKLLDFGLAKLAEGAVGDGPTGQTDSTVSYTGTQSGTVVGTAPYMSPEQTRGDPLDRRTDVWAMGCLLFEALSGRRAFEGRTASDAIAAVLKGEPDWRQLPSGLPSALQSVVRGCLEKSLSRRVSSCREVKRLLEESRSASASRPTAPATGPATRPAVGPSRGSIYAQYRGCVLSIAWVAILAFGLGIFGSRIYLTRSGGAGGVTAGGDGATDLLTETLVSTQIEVAEFELDSKNYQAAIDQAKGALELSPDNAEAVAIIDRAQRKLDRLGELATTATTALDAGDLRAASTALSEVLTLDPGHPVVAELSPKLGREFRDQAARAREAMQQTRTAAAGYPATDAVRQAGELVAEAESAMNGESYVVAAQRFLEARDMFDRARREGLAGVRAADATRLAEARLAEDERRRLAVAATPQPTPTVRPAASPAPAPSTPPPALAQPTPGATPVGLTPTPVPSLSPQEIAVRAVLDRYARAYEDRDMSLLKQVWPSFRDEKHLAAAFKMIDRWQVGLSIESVSIRGGRATVVVARQDVVNGAETPRRRQTFTLVETHDGWVIESVSG